MKVAVAGAVVVADLADLADRAGPLRQRVLALRLRQRSRARHKPVRDLAAVGQVVPVVLVAPVRTTATARVRRIEK